MQVEVEGRRFKEGFTVCENSKEMEQVDGSNSSLLSKNFPNA